MNINSILDTRISLQGCPNELPHTKWLKTTGIHFLSVREVEILKSRCRQCWSFLQDLQDDTFHSSLLTAGGSSCAWHSLTCAFITSICPSIFTWLLNLCLGFSNTPLLSLIRIPVLDLEPLLNPGWSHPKILNLIISPNTLFPDKVTFTSIRS